MLIKAPYPNFLKVPSYLEVEPCQVSYSNYAELKINLMFSKELTSAGVFC